MNTEPATNYAAWLRRLCIGDAVQVQDGSGHILRVFNIEPDKIHAKDKTNGVHRTFIFSRDTGELITTDRPPRLHPLAG